jgi:hypothetical protein
MSNSLSPELVLVLPEAQRAAAIRALPLPAIWSPAPLGLASRVARAPTTRVLIGTALLYFVTKLVWTIGTAVLYVLVAVALVVLLTLLF